MATKKSAKGAQHKGHTLSSEDRNELKGSTYAFPAKRKEPLSDASHVRNAITRFDQVKDVTDTEREEAFGHIKTAAKKFGVEMTATRWKELGKTPSASKKAAKNVAKKSVKKALKK